MRTSILRRIGTAGGGVVALAAIAFGVMAIDGGTSDGEAIGTGSPDRYITVAEQEPTTTEGKEPYMGLCAGDEVPDLKVERFPDAKTRGAPTVLDALQEIVPTAKAANVVETPLGPTDKGAPVWVEVAGGTYIVGPAPAGGWFASAATQEGCVSLKQLPLSELTP